MSECTGCGYSIVSATLSGNMKSSCPAAGYEKAGLLHTASGLRCLYRPPMHKAATPRRRVFFAAMNSDCHAQHGEGFGMKNLLWQNKNRDSPAAAGKSRFFAFNCVITEQGQARFSRGGKAFIKSNGSDCNRRKMCSLPAGGDIMHPGEGSTSIPPLPRRSAKKKVRLRLTARHG